MKRLYINHIFKKDVKKTRKKKTRKKQEKKRRKKQEKKTKKNVRHRMRCKALPVSSVVAADSTNIILDAPCLGASYALGQLSSIIPIKTMGIHMSSYHFPFINGNRARGTSGPWSGSAYAELATTSHCRKFYK